MTKYTSIECEPRDYDSVTFVASTGERHTVKTQDLYDTEDSYRCTTKTPDGQEWELEFPFAFEAMWGKMAMDLIVKRLVEAGIKPWVHVGSDGVECCGVATVDGTIRSTNFKGYSWGFIENAWKVNEMDNASTKDLLSSAESWGGCESIDCDVLSEMEAHEAQKA